MDKYAPGIRASELSLVEIPKTPADSAVVTEGLSPAVAAEGDAAGTDKFLAEAAREFQAGQLDQPLWARAVVQASGNQELARPAYLRARATALRVAKRNERTGRSAGHAGAALGVEDAPVGRKSRGADTSKESGQGYHRVAAMLRKRPMWVACILGSLVLVAGLIALLSGSDRADPPHGATVPPPVNESRPSTPPNNAQTAGSNAGGPTRPETTNQDFASQLQALKDAGNWNVLVLYAAEWTRKQPRNPNAWKELSAGYLKLRQFNDAFDAATKAVGMAPGDFLMWRNLGQVNIALNEPAAALLAFERAGDLNNEDVTSLVQTGTLNMQFGRLPAAKIAFAKALAASPDNVDALCGAALIAQQEGRVKEAEAMTRQLKDSGGRCRDLNSGESVSVPPGGSAKNKPISAAGR